MRRSHISDGIGREGDKFFFSLLDSLINNSVLSVLVTQSYLTLCDPMDCSPLGSSVHGILQARILGWVAIVFSGRFSKPADGTQVSCIVVRFLYHLSRQAADKSSFFLSWELKTVVIHQWESLTAGVQPRLIQGIRSGDGVGEDQDTIASIRY